MYVYFWYRGNRRKLCLRLKRMYISGKDTIRGNLCLRFKCLYISGKEKIRGNLCLRFKCLYISGKETTEKAMFKIKMYVYFW